MTENEVIEQLEIFTEWNREDQWLDVGDMEELVNICVKALKEVAQYRAIGAVEECREAMERQRAKKPLKYETHEDYDDGICPNCKVPVNDVFGYCTDCGQSLLWEHDDE